MDEEAIAASNCQQIVGSPAEHIENQNARNEC